MPTALLSVYEKQDVVSFAQELVRLGWDILASGGTAKALREGAVPVRDVADIVGGGPILGHRVVTLSRELHAGLLARPEDAAEMTALNIPYIDMVVVDMYPLKEATSIPGTSLEMVLESTDIGGPTMLQAGAKGNRIVVCDTADWPAVATWLRLGMQQKNEFVNRLAAKAERVVAEYCLESARYRGGDRYAGLIGDKWADCSYGENRWQSPAGLYTVAGGDPLALDRFELIEGKPPSYINWRDLDRLLQTITHAAAVRHENFGRVPNIAVGAKHGNPCGASWAKDPETAARDMALGDSRALFGGMVMTNFGVTERIADAMLNAGSRGRRVLDGVAAPAFTDGALEHLARKNGRCRLYRNPALAHLSGSSLAQDDLYVPVRGGFLRQPNYTHVLTGDELVQGLVQGVIPQRAYSNNTDPLLAWAVGATSNSNTVTLVKDSMLIGNGVGQQDRVGACELAIKRARDAGHDIEGAVAYSDSFFPFNDGPERLIEAGVKCILATSGSVNDERLKELCRERDIHLMLVADSRARGFFGH